MLPLCEPSFRCFCTDNSYHLVVIVTAVFGLFGLGCAYVEH